MAPPGKGVPSAPFAETPVVRNLNALMEQEISGVLIIDKPPRMTSHDVVARVRRLLGIRQVGHFGTLDPFATGVLPLSVGKATRFAQFYLKSRKAYEGTMRFGFSTDTYDGTGKPTSEEPAASVGVEPLEKLFREFTGRLDADSSPVFRQADRRDTGLRACPPEQTCPSEAGGSGGLCVGVIVIRWTPCPLCRGVFRRNLRSLACPRYRPKAGMWSPPGRFAADGRGRIYPGPLGDSGGA